MMIIIMETFSLNIYPSTYVSKNAIKRKKKAISIQPLSIKLGMAVLHTQYEI